MLKPVQKYFENLLWNPRIEGAPTAVRFVARMARFPFAILRDAAEGELTLRAMSMVYTTLLAIVPLIAFSFSVLKAFGFHNQVEPLLYSFLSPLGQEGVKLTDQIIGFVANVPGVPLGSVGLALLLYAVVSMVQKIEEAFNFVWQVQRSRSLGRRFSDYLSVILIAPVLLAAALGSRGVVANNSLVQRLLDIDVISGGLLFAGKFMPLLLVIGAFAFIYGFIPNTSVRFRAALVGGVVGGLLWSLLGSLFSSFVRASTTYEVIYSTFAIPLLALIWLYISWLVVLLGARISYYYQHPEFLRRGRDRIQLTNRLRERLALTLMYSVGDEFRNERPHWTVNTLATHVGMPANALAEIVAQLERAGLLVMTENDVLMPGRDTERIALTEILDCVRRGPTSDQVLRTSSLQRVDQIVDDIEITVGEHLAGRSLKDLIDSTPTPDPQDDDQSDDKVTGLFST